MHVPGVCVPWNSNGNPLAGNTIEIRNPQGHPVAKGQVGEIYACGPTVTNGYYLANVQDHDTKQDGWLRTGDMGLVDHDSYIYVTGRNQDLIKHNGAQISPHELEAVILTHPSVLDVVVVGLELPDGNELPTAFVVLRTAATSATEEVASYTDIRVSPYKRLRGRLYAVDVIPRNPMGKIQYRELRELAKNPYAAGGNCRKGKFKS